MERRKNGESQKWTDVETESRRNGETQKQGVVEIERCRNGETQKRGVVEIERRRNGEIYRDIQKRGEVDSAKSCLIKQLISINRTNKNYLKLVKKNSL